MADRSDKTLFLETFGCQMNFLDSELVLGQLRRMGYRRTADRDAADLVLFNTCSVRDHAENKVNSRLGELRPVKAARPGMIIGVLGCQAEREGRTLISRFPQIDLLCGPNELHQLPALVARVQSARVRAVALMGGLAGRLAEQRSARAGEPADDGIESLDLGRQFVTGENPLQAYVRVQRGCDKFCAYCIVPTVRGREKSRPPEHIIAEAEALAAAGCREITLLGQTVSSYSQTDEQGGPVGLARLLERVAAIDGLLRVRFVTSYPGGFDEDIFRVMRDVPKVCPYLHIPAQSGSDRMLRAMKRQYTAADYYRLMETARRIVPEIALASDFIVGFPGETDADFAETVRMVQQVRYKNCFVFKYSPRPGTVAARRLPDDVNEQTKRDRNNQLLAVQAEVSATFNEKLVGQSVNILIEGPSKQAQADGDAGEPAGRDNPAPASRQLTGRTTADQIVVFDCPADIEPGQLVGRLADVTIATVTPYTLIGQLRVESLDLTPRTDNPLRYKSLTG